MQDMLSNELQDIRRAIAACGAQDALRERLQGYFDELLRLASAGAKPARLEEAYRKGMQTLCTFYNAQDPNANGARVRLELSGFCEDLAFCCNLLCGEGRVLFWAPEPVPVVCAPRALLWAALNLLSNALRYAEHAPVVLRVFTHTDFAGLAVASSGRFDAGAFSCAMHKAGGGLGFVRRTASAHGGRLFLCNARRQTTLALSLARSAQDAQCPAIWQSCFADWLSDRLSPVYAALSDLCAPPVF